MIFTIFIWVALSLVAGWIAQDKGREPLGFVLVSLFLTPIIGILAAIGCQAHARTAAPPPAPELPPAPSLRDHPWGIK